MEKSGAQSVCWSEAESVMLTTNNRTAMVLFNYFSLRAGVRHFSAKDPVINMLEFSCHMFLLQLLDSAILVEEQMDNV